MKALIFTISFNHQIKLEIFSNQIRFAQLENFRIKKVWSLVRGIILGTIFALILAFYSYSQIKDRTTFYFGAS